MIYHELNFCADWRFTVLAWAPPRKTRAKMEAGAGFRSVMMVSLLP